MGSCLGKKEEQVYEEKELEHITKVLKDNINKPNAQQTLKHVARYYQFKAILKCNQSVSNKIKEMNQSIQNPIKNSMLQNMEIYSKSVLKILSKLNDVEKTISEDINTVKNQKKQLQQKLSLKKLRSTMKFNSVQKGSYQNNRQKVQSQVPKKNIEEKIIVEDNLNKKESQPFSSFTESGMIKQEHPDVINSPVDSKRQAQSDLIENKEQDIQFIKDKLKEAYKQLQNYYQVLERKKKEIQEIKQYHKKQFEDMDLRLSKNIQNIQQLQNTLAKKQEQIMFRKRQNQILTTQNIKYLNLIQELKQKLKSSRISSKNQYERQSYIIVGKSQIQKSPDQESYQILFKLFSLSKLLPLTDQFEKAIGVRQLIKQMFKRKVKETKLLFIFDKINPVHYDKYIEERKNLILLIKTSNGTIIGAYAGQVNQQNQVSQSFLFSILPNKQPVVLKTEKNIKNITNDKNYMIFGFDQIRLKAKTQQIYCNISGLQSVYKLEGRKVNIERFLGNQKRQISAEQYQMHEIIFK